MPAKIRKLEIENLRGSKVRRGPLIVLSIGLIFIFVLTFLTFFSKTSVVKDVLTNNVFSSGPNINSTDGRVNILLLGNAGGKHDGAELTDSIIIASIDLKTKNAVLFSIPRDVWLESINHKINAAYEIGIRSGEGLNFVKDKIDDLLGIPIHYAVRIDFTGFAKAVDLIGGIEVDVPKTFDDYNYPIEGKENDLCGLTEKEMDINDETAKLLNLTLGKHKVLVDREDRIATNSSFFWCRYERIHFNKGSTNLDGITALKFVRSRMGTNGEGSDFARSRRQQLVIEAFREKALSIPTLANPGKVTELISTFNKSVETDIPLDKFLDFYNLAKSINKTESVVLGDLGDGKSLFYNPPPSEYGGGWVLVPQGKDFSKIAELVKLKLEEISVEP
ncbi:MAG: hypothetical protein US86_C0001G0425 [Candidatus Daviesbacteria bacterium GW2011_GWA2_38_24]|uniref:Cell envelope-related transcriptional attenuator domain-containing protein n=1 Tax=Candidatus Daviesbacteria bacterium GW2011_GWA2_38_24 TaxID=1618422 RepID=A0A0G0JIF8_9BACT|nr:MAG: hypothetical protein US86_C0001G0425 [Candidatus Daviesbacteria bacterium GW2011_GWA2_38_24]KKQ79205.1 MAG: hypothetical protein UT01_C0047G0006 [Candidatus Daviesbacteria bacterium GW2011_GWA1_38_7]